MSAAIREERRRIETAHLMGAGGLETVGRLTHMVDMVIETLALRADAGYDAGQGQYVLVAEGGYGRREMCPASDVDVMLLFKDEDVGLAQLSAYIFHMLVDLGFELGYSYRAIPDALTLAEGDFKSLSSLLDARPLETSNQQIFTEFQQQFAALLTQERVASFVEWRLAERERRHREQAGRSGEPNTKEGRGGLRDFHDVMWILRVTTGGVGLAGLEASGVLTKAECAQCLAVFDFLLRVRNQQHFGFGKCDVLSVDQRRTVAYGLGFPDERRFMERYTHSTRELRHLSSLALRRLLDRGHGDLSERG